MVTIRHLASSTYVADFPYEVVWWDEASTMTSEERDNIRIATLIVVLAHFVLYSILSLFGGRP